MASRFAAKCVVLAALGAMLAIFPRPLNFGEASTRETTTGAPPPASGPASRREAMLAPASETPAWPQRTETTLYDNWTVTCVDRNDGKGMICSALLRIADPNRNAVVFAWLVGRNAEGALLSVLQTPTSVMIQKGVELTIGNGALRRLAFNSCIPQNCEAAVGMDDAFRKELVSNRAATATIVAVNGQGVHFNVNLAGIERALAAVGR